MKTWEMTRTLYKVSDFISWQKAKTLVLSPSFQRRPVWKRGAKSYLIDTVVRGLPVPIIFLREQKPDLTRLESRREVVDGQQRLRTLFSYIAPSLLDDFHPRQDDFTIQSTHNKELAGKSFTELPREYQQRILDYQFSVHVLPAEADDREILGIFARMNATGVKLNRQELRNAEYFGEFKTSMYNLAFEQLPQWRNWKMFTEDSIARMEEVELTSEFAMLMLKGLTDKRHPSIDQIYREKDASYRERTGVERRFRVVMDTIEAKLGREMECLPFRKKTLFYSLFAFLYDLQFGIGSPVEKSSRPKAINSGTVASVKLAGKKIEAKEAPEKVLDAVKIRTTTKSSRGSILDYFRREAQLGKTSD